MVGFIAVLIAKLLSPFSAIAAIAIVLIGARRWWIIPIAALVFALVGEAILSSFSIGRRPFAHFEVAIVAGLIVSAAAYFIRNRVAGPKGD